MATLPYVTVDAFTTVKFRGNPAAVVVFPKENTADALDLRQRQAAKEAVVWTRGLMPARTALAGKDGFPPDTFLADVAREMQGMVKEEIGSIWMVSAPPALPSLPERTFPPS